MGFESVENQVEMLKCWICDDAEFDSKQKLSVHQTHCKLKNPNYKERTDRIPFGTPTQRFILPREDQEKFHYHVFNDNWRKEPGRIQRARMAGYEVVDHERSGETTGTNDDGTEIKGVLMRIPKETYDQDQAAKQQEIDKVDDQISRGKFESGKNTYMPSGGIKTEVKLTG
jgi:hypothetical protein